MIFSYDWLKDYIKGKLPRPKELAELLTLHSFEVEEVKKVGKDFVLDIGILPNRAPDCFSHLGVAREAAVITNLKFQIPETKIFEDKELKTKDFVSVEVKNKAACFRYNARVVYDVKVGVSPRWLQERLLACGLRPINNIVDVANFVMLETGQPLHAFDAQKLEDKKIIVRFAKNREKIITLDEERYELDEKILVIADKKRPIALAGIKGGIIPEITKTTKIVVLESANFNPRVIRQGSKIIDLKTDASLRFEHGIDPNLTEFGINRAVALIQKIAGGKITQDLTDFYPKKILPKRIKLELDYAERLLGVKIPQREMEDILKRLGFKILNTKQRIENTPKQSLKDDRRQAKYLLVEVPTFRLDISIPEDLIEEIGRIYGYEKIPASFPSVSLAPPQKNLDIFWEDFSKNILKETGFSEVYNYSFISEKEARLFKFNTNLLELENPVSSEQKYLRPSLMPNLLKNAEKNLRNFNLIKIFELGRIFYEKREAEKRKQIIEKRALSGLISGEAFYEAKGILDSLFNKLGISDVWYDEYQPTPERSKISIWHPQKCAEVKIGNEEIGFLGEISSKITEELKINSKIVIFDIDFEKLAKLSSEEHEYRPIPRYPSAVRDLAVLVPRRVRVEEVLNEIEETGGFLLRDVDLFDIYEGEEIPEGKKNLAFHLIYQAQDRTLSSKEIDEIHRKIIKVLEKNPDWEIRR